ncbi:serine/threonine-protein kinase phg2 isoform X1 [Drosophila subobscura]|uniref:serine/threonine-protein kinase phg2 isoform X1 n=2 Tax=Drosophila subobscura TaxID=7241 RepID=UPI00155A9656|nr:serine/threonine-protein kinase phg2 isoform X1 [Drosophila subobscura]
MRAENPETCGASLKIGGSLRETAGRACVRERVHSTPHAHMLALARPRQPPPPPPPKANPRQRLTSASTALTTARNDYSAPMLNPQRKPNLVEGASTSSATAMLASTSNSAALSAASSSMDACDERTMLLSETPKNDVGAPAPSPPTTLPLVHTTTTTSTHPSQQQHHQRQNINNNNARIEASASSGNSCSASANVSSNNNNENNTISADCDAGAADDLSSDLSDRFPRPPATSAFATATGNPKKPGKLSKLGSKSVGLKRVSFGSSKGSMVETLVFETPTPLSEHVEATFGFEAATSATEGVAVAAGQPQQPSQLHPQSQYLPPAGHGDYTKLNMDDSGIEVQEESERSIVRVSIYQSSQPQQICPPVEYIQGPYSDGLDLTIGSYTIDPTTMSTTSATMQQHQQIGLGAAYDRQQSTDSGWDNPFRPGGDLSREADEIVNMIRGGKPITPTEDRTIGNGSAQHADDNCNGGTAVGESVTRSNLSQNQATAQNGTNSHASKLATVGNATAGGGGGVGRVEGQSNSSTNGVTALGQVSKQVVPGPTSASHVVIDEKKGKKKGCCVVQ